MLVVGALLWLGDGVTVRSPSPWHAQGCAAPTSTLTLAPSPHPVQAAPPSDVTSLYHPPSEHEALFRRLPGAAAEVDGGVKHTLKQLELLLGEVRVCRVGWRGQGVQG